MAKLIPMPKPKGKRTVKPKLEASPVAGSASAEAPAEVPTAKTVIQTETKADPAETPPTSTTTESQPVLGNAEPPVAEVPAEKTARVEKKATRQEKKDKKSKGNKKLNFSTSSFGISKERDFFIENLALLLTAGMDMLTALDSLRTEVRSPRMKKIIDYLKEEIDAGSSLGHALENTKLLPTKIVSLVRIGEETGRLSENLKVVVEQQQKERVFKSQIRSAMMYPILILALTLIIGIGIAWFILPRLASVFTDLNAELPTLTRLLIGFGDLLSSYGVLLVPLGLGIIGAIVYFLFFYRKTSFIGQEMLFAVPVVRKLIQDIELSRFGFILGTLLESGLPVVEALASLNQATSFHSYQKLYKYLEKSVEEGNSFQKSFAAFPKAKKYIPSSIQHMVVAGEQSGHLSEILLKIGATFEQKTEIATKNLTVLLEPLLLLIVWMGVVGVALAVILPIYNLIGGFNV